MVIMGHEDFKTKNGALFYHFHRKQFLFLNCTETETQVGFDKGLLCANQRRRVRGMGEFWLRASRPVDVS